MDSTETRIENHRSLFGVLLGFGISILPAPPGTSKDLVRLSQFTHSRDVSWGVVSQVPSVLRPYLSEVHVSLLMYPLVGKLVFKVKSRDNRSDSRDSNNWFGSPGLWKVPHGVPVMVRRVGPDVSFPASPGV